MLSVDTWLILTNSIVMQFSGSLDIWMAVGRVRVGYTWVLGSVSRLDPRICGFGNPKYFGFGADS